MTEIFNYMFKDDKFFQKAGVFFILSAIASFFASYGAELCSLKNYSGIGYIILALLLCATTTGYGISCAKALSAQENNYILPFLNPMKNFILGIKWSISVFLLCLAAGVASFLVAFIAASIAIIFKFKAIITIFFILLNIALIIAILYYSLVLYRMFAQTEQLTSYLQFKKAEELIKTDRKHYLIFTGIFIGINLLTFIIAVIIGIIINILFPNIAASPVLNAMTSIIGAFIGVYIMYVTAFLAAKAIKS